MAEFNGGEIVSDAGATLLHQVEQSFGIVRGFAACFEDHRDPDRVEHTVEELLLQRVMALALGYEDLNDHDELRRSNIDASEGSVEELERIVGVIRERWPRVEIWVRGDSGFAREEFMRWCEDNGVDYVFGLARNARLERYLAPALSRAEKLAEASGAPQRVYEEMGYRTLESWSRLRRVVGKAEVLPKGPNPRFVVTSLSAERFDAKALYETIYCTRGEMENRIKEQQLYLFATRTSAQKMAVNQVRLWLSSLAYVLIETLRRLRPPRLAG